MAPSRIPKRAPQATYEESDSDQYSDKQGISSPSILDTAEGGNINDTDSDAASSEADSTNTAGEDSDHHETIKRRLTTVSFGALAKAQDALDSNDSNNRKRKRGSELSADAESKLEGLRERLKELRQNKEKSGKAAKADKYSASSTIKNNKDVSVVERHKGAAASPDNEDEDGSSDGSSVDFESDAEEKAAVKKSRSSKHAPAEQSSKRAVTRRRTVVPLARSTNRDPRFDPLSGPVNEHAFAQKYSFLDNYRQSEISELRAGLKNPKLSDTDRETLKRKILSMESRQAAKVAKEREQKVEKEHRKKEKEMVAQGKKPFYMKKSEVKKQALVDRFESMKGKHRDKVIERRRKKLASKERKSMPDARRS